METLTSLIPRPIQVETDSISGELHIDGNIERNTVQFRFRFHNTMETAPVCLTIAASGKTYRYYCTIQEKKYKEIVTPVFCPEFSVCQCFCLKKVETLVTFFPKNQKNELQIDKDIV